jgi:hypothetical protein
VPSVPHWVHLSSILGTRCNVGADADVVQALLPKRTPDVAPQNSLIRPARGL